MPIAFTCDYGKPLQAEDRCAGRMTRCPRCGRELVIPRRADAGGDILGPHWWQN